MTTTLDWVYGANTKSTSIRQWGGVGTGLWDNSTNTGAFTFIAGRISGTALHCVETGTGNTFLARNLVPARSRVMALWFRVPIAPVFDGSGLLQVYDATSSGMVRFEVNAAGNIRAQAGGGSRQVGPSVADNAWHLLNFWIDTSGSTWTLHWSIDDSGQTNATHTGHVATDSAFVSIGNVTTTHNLTFDIDDLITGVISAEFPLATVANNHQVIASVPNADGTHDNSGGVLLNQASAVIGTAWSLLDEWPANTTDYVMQFNAGASNYAEVNFQDATGSPTIWAVQATMAGKSNGGSGSPDNGTTVILDGSSNSLTTVYSGDMTDASGPAYKQALVAAPANGWATDFNGTKARIGFSTDVSPAPQWTALMLEYVTAVTSITATAAVTVSAAAHVASALRTRFGTADATVTATVSANLTIASGAITGSKWDTTDETWDDASATWDGTNVAGATVTITALVSATLIRSGLSLPVTANVTVSTVVTGDQIRLWSAQTSVPVSADISASAMDTAPGIAQVVGTAMVSAVPLHIALAQAHVAVATSIAASPSGHIGITRFHALYRPLIRLEAFSRGIIRLEASTLGVEAPIRKSDDWFVGEDQDYEWEVKSSATQLQNITGFTIEFRMAIARGQSSILTKSAAVTNGALGLCEVDFDAADTASLTAQRYFYTLSRTDAAHNQVLAFGNAFLQARVA